MVAIVSGMGAGLDLSSRQVLGQAGVAGHAPEGRNGQGVYVNIANGLLVVQNQDDLLVARGQDAAALRTYDARGNLRDVADARAHVVMEYDAVGNRTRVATFVNYQGTGGETSAGADRYFRYDAMNRQVVVDAVDSAGNLGTQGHRITYDKSGNRTSDLYWGNKVATSGGEQILVGYDEDGAAVYGTTAVNFTASTGYSTEEYRYDALDRLQSVVKDGVQIDMRYYDGADRVVRSGPGNALPLKYSELINAGLAPDQVNGKEIRLNRYDANGRMLHQRVLKSDGGQKMDISWDVGESFVVRAPTWFNPVPDYVNADGYDNAGNAIGYIVQSHEGGYINEYRTTINRYEAYQAGTTTGTSTKLIAGTSTQQYDANGFLVGLVDSTQGQNNRTFVNDAGGRALYVNQAGNIQRQMIVNGELLGTYGVGVNQLNPMSGFNNNPNFANVVDFDFGYSRVSASYPSASPGAYIVRTGDTLQSIAQSAYGDSALWYRIAEANGLMSNNDVKVGQTLNIPNRVSTISNNNTTFKPYDPSQIEGDKAPSLATPKPKKKSWVKQLAMIVVAVVVAYFTAGTYLGAFGATCTAAGSSVSSLIVAGALGGAAGSIASQAVGIALGAQEEFSWKGVALSAIGGGVSMGLGGFDGLGGYDFKAGDLGNRVIQAAVGNAVTQGIGVVTGLQHRFDWKGVAASAVGAGVGQQVGLTLGPSFGGRLSTGLLAGGAAALARGGRVSVTQVAIDAFGNALGRGLAGTSTAGDGTRDSSSYAYESEMDRASDLYNPASAYDYRNGLDVQSDFAATQRQRDAFYGWATGNDGVGFKPDAGVGTVGMRYAGVRAPMFDDTRVFSDSRDPQASVANLGRYGESLTQVLPINPALLGGATATSGYQVIRPTGAGAPPPYDIIRDLPGGAPGFSPANPSLGFGMPAKPMDDQSWINWKAMPLPMQIMKGFSDYLTYKITGGSGPNNAENRGLKWTLESSSKSTDAQAYEDGIEGSSYDPATRRRNTPALQFTNPNPAGRDEVRLDGVDPLDPTVLIDRKLNATTRSKQISDVQRWAEALRQNPEYSIRVEVPDNSAYRNVIRLLNRAGVESSPIRVEIKK